MLLALKEEGTPVMFPLAMVAMQTQRWSLAAERLDEYLQDDPNDIWAVFYRTQAARELGDSESALQWSQKLMTHPQVTPEMFVEVGFVHLQAGLAGFAIDAFSRATKSPNTFELASYWQGATLWDQGRLTDALRILEVGAKDAKATPILVKLAEVQLSFGLAVEAASTIRRALKLDPRLDIAHMILARAASALGDQETSQRAWNLALEHAENTSRILEIRAFIDQSIGNFEEAEKSLLNSIEQNPERGQSYSLIFAGRRATQADTAILENAAKAFATTTDLESKKHLAYALGKAHHDLGEYEQAAKHYAEANKLVREILFQGFPCDLSEIKALHSDFIEMFTPAFFEANTPNGDPSTLPIFVLGIIRSGTTLTEQILSSTKSITGAGELGFWSNLGHAFIDFDNKTLIPDLLKVGTQEYLEMLWTFAKGAPHATDKNPANYAACGLIHCALPNAKMICVRRNPIDVAMSIWTTPMQTNAPYVGDKRAIVEAIKDCERLTRHWESVLPKDRFTIVRYEDLILNKEATVKGLFDFLNLEWDPAVLNHEGNTRSIFTPSMWQVRQATYYSSIDRWKPYEPWLEEFSELLP